LFKLALAKLFSFCYNWQGHRTTGFVETLWQQIRNRIVVSVAETSALKRDIRLHQWIHFDVGWASKNHWFFEPAPPGGKGCIHQVWGTESKCKM